MKPHLDTVIALLFKALVVSLCLVAAIAVGVAFLQFLAPFIRLQMDALQSDILAATTTVLFLYVVRGAYAWCHRHAATLLSKDRNA